ncbi:MAG: SPOR domain-containing protein [Gemmatimonadaceae bacterium]
MHRLIVLALVVAACSGDRQAPSAAASSQAARGPDQVVLRIPRSGGTARAYLYPHLDSVVWAAAGAPPVARVMGFDADAGLVALVDNKGQPRRVDLRLGEIRFASRAPLTSLASANGTDIYGIAADGSVLRMTPSGDWNFKPPSPARWVFPQPGGLLIIASGDRSATKLWSIRAPDDEILDSASLPPVSRGIRTQVGDRLYFTADSGLAGVMARDLVRVKNIDLRETVVAMSPTPSGDRLYIATAGTNRISILNRYSETVTGSVALPGVVSELRMDPLGQQILARPAAGGDSAWIIAIGSSRPAGTLKTAWRADLPAFAPASTIATARGDDVIFVNANTLQAVTTVVGGARDFWYFFSWNGFRPRSAGLDQPVTFRTPDSTIRNDSVTTPSPDSGAPTPPMRDTAPSMIVPPTSYPQPSRQGYLLSFASLLTEERARQVAAGIEVNGIRPHVLSAPSGSTTLYRVVLGPYPSREEAERVGRESGRQHWIFEASK